MPPTRRYFSMAIGCKSAHLPRRAELQDRVGVKAGASAGVTSGL